MSAVRWQPIKTAPQDGTIIIVKAGYGYVRAAFYDNGTLYDNDSGNEITQRVQYWIQWPENPA